ncbi:uncharacterized protein A4U43_C04F14100 [Asparagus officinalis]|uniref:Enoyl reductase (ER) domain-containing protein n=1 Tax=Asparagus officinalis TaxID=4686 RepID=A0A5P1F2J9_ASPOF|nr:uncharacterized protein A4U43_C04F14100 [Asparagus officinalis]
MSREVHTIKCKAAICWGPEEPLTVEEIEVEPPQSSEVRLRLLFASLCHTDVIRRSGFRYPLYPRILGHEGVGVIESVGKGVTDFKEGDIVIPSFIGECGDCENCKSAKTNVCLKYPTNFNGLMADNTSRMSVKGQKLYHLFWCSTFTEFTVVDHNYIVKINPELQLAHASLLSCGFTTGFGTAWKEAKVHRGSSVAVFGLGGVGIGAIIGAKLLGASKIIGVDLNNRKKEKAEFFGMTDFINPKEIENKTCVEMIKEMTGGMGVDYSFECSGAGSVVNEAVEATVMGRGITIMLGGAEKNASISCLALLGGRTLKGTTFGGIKPRSDLPSIITKCINKR